MRPDAGKVVSEGAVDDFATGVSSKFPRLAPATIEVCEQLKASAIVKDGGNAINNVFKK